MENLKNKAAPHNSARSLRQDFSPIQSLENEGILYVFLVFQTEEVGQKDGGDSQTQLCGAAIRKQAIGCLRKLPMACFLIRCFLLFMENFPEACGKEENTKPLSQNQDRKPETKK